jgi:hypothetical protein
MEKRPCGMTRKAMPSLTDAEIEDGYPIHHDGHVYTAYEVPDDDGHACGHDEDGRDCDMRFVWTVWGCWVFVSAELSEHDMALAGKQAA